MKKRKVAAMFCSAVLACSLISGCSGLGSDEPVSKTETKEEKTEGTSDQEAADHVADLIDTIYVQERTDETDVQCEEAREAWDALTDAQKELVSGENADPDYFGRDTGDASKDDRGKGAARSQLRYIFQRQPCGGYQGNRRCSSGSLS